MTYPKLPGTNDEVARLSAMATITATGNSGTLDQGSAFAPGGEGQKTSVFLNVATLKQSAGNETYTVKAQESSDGSTWVDISQAQPITATGALSFGIFIKLQYQRVVLTLGGTSPSIQFESYLNAGV